MSALISAASPEKIDGDTKLRALRAFGSLIVCLYNNGLFSKLGFSENWNSKEFLSRCIHEHATSKYILALIGRDIDFFFSI